MLNLPRTDDDIKDMSETHQAILDQAKIVEDDLASYVTACFNTARDSRQVAQVDSRIIRALRRRRREYDPEDADIVAETSNIYIPIIDLKCRAALSWMTDILANAEEQPWTFNPTPNPEIPDHIREVAIENLKQEILQMGLSDPGAIVAAAKRYKTAAREFVMQQATASCLQMETLVRDQLLEGGWLDQFHKFLDDVTTYPTAVFEAPVVRYKPRMKWVKDKIVTEEALTRDCERVDPIDVFPSFDSTTTQDGSYICVRKRLTYAFLHKCLSIPAFKKEAIRRLLDKFQDRGLRVDVQTDYEEDWLKDRSPRVGNTEYIEGIAYYGIVKGQLLTKAGVLVSDPQKPYEAVIWVIDNETIYSVLNPHPLGKRPLYSTSFKPVNGSFWGEALPDLLESVERMANAAARSLARNMAFSSGPFGEYDGTRLAEDETEIHHIEPHRLYQTEPSMSGTSEPAFKFHKIDSNAAELQGITENYMKMADDISGIPAYVLGNPQVAGAGRTMGGLSMLMGNAAKGIKQVINNVDKDVIVPLVTAYYYFELKFGEDESAKVDAQVIALGSNGILQRELSQSRTVEMMQIIAPFIPFIPPQGVQFLLREVFKSRGYNVDKIIPNPDRAAMLNGGVMPQQTPPQSQPGTPQPPLDGRNIPSPSPDNQFRLPQTTP